MRAKDDGQFCEQLAQYLWEPAVDLGGKRHNPAIQIHHFACHCDTNKPESNNYELSLRSGRFRGTRKVRLGRLTDELVQLGMKARSDRRARPLVFLNACGTGDLDPKGAGSFPNTFLKKRLGFIGFIGTETNIPDKFASTFSEVMYTHLLGGLQLGEAIHAARWKLLRTKRNPLGILYSLYAEPEIQVRRPVEEIKGRYVRR
jgi:hypothetical protein